jgi:hypothetical protein
MRSLSFVLGLVTWLEARGAVLRITEDGFLRADLDPMPDMDHDRADEIARTILALRAEIKQVLRDRAVLH